MKDWLRGKTGGLCVFLLIAGLVIGGLGWVTAAVLRLEREQAEARSTAERDSRVRLALWRLEGAVAPLRAREDGRAYDHYSALYAVRQTYRRDAEVWGMGTVLEPSPLLSSDVQPWVLLHFQLAAGKRWMSPQVPEGRVHEALVQAGIYSDDDPIVQARTELLARLNRDLGAERVLEQARAVVPLANHKDLTVLARSQPLQQPPPTQSASFPRNFPNQGPQPQQPYNDFELRQGQSSFNNGPDVRRERLNVAVNNTLDNGTTWMTGAGEGRTSDGVETLVQLSPMAAFWVSDAQGDYLFLARRVQVQTREVIQGVMLDPTALQADLASQVQDLFPDARVVPQKEAIPPYPERTLAALPFQLELGPQPSAPPEPGWTPLRVGLTLSWVAALVALMAVGLGGSSLLALSLRRIRFVSAVTHELRTPLTTLRLYLDMLQNGLVRDESQRLEYICTLNAEADRLHRLVNNVLDYSRLEDHRPQLARTTLTATALLAQVADTWRTRCLTAEKDLVVEEGDVALSVSTDPGLVEQVLGNLLDNACKYSRDAADRRLWLRARRDGRWAIFEVEDRGPGIPAPERRAIFHAFRRGSSAEVTAGGVGLGLALASRWARLLGGRLKLAPTPAAGGACFRLMLHCQDT